MIKVGHKFSEARLAKNLSLEEVSKATKIKKDFLQSIEKGDYKKLPSPAYALGFVRNYARFLGLDDLEMLALFRREYDSDKAYAVLPKGFVRSGEIQTKRIRIGRNFIWAGAVFLFLASFVFLQYKDAIFNPSLQIDQPKEGETLTSSDLIVKGDTDPNSTVYVEDQLVSVEDDGQFSKVITVFPGKTEVMVKSTNRFGKETVKAVRINVKPGY